MSSLNRGERIEVLQKLLKKHYKPVALPQGRTVLDHLIYACCLEDSKFEVADELFAKLQQDYFDWNEARVTTITELAELLSIHPMPVQVAVRVKKALQGIFESRYSFDIEDLAKLNLGKATEVVENWVGGNKFVPAFMQQNAFGGHAIAIDNSALQALEAIGIAQPADIQKKQISGLERAVPKNKGAEVFSLLHQFAVDFMKDKKLPGVAAILAELAVEPAPPKPTKVVAKAPEKPAATAPKKPEKKEPEKKEPEKASGTKAQASLKPAPSGKAPAKPEVKAKVDIKAKPEVKPKTEGKPKPESKPDTKSKSLPPPKAAPKAASKAPPAKPGKGDTKKPSKPMAKQPPTKDSKSSSKKPITSNKGLSKKKPK
jgi:endonuclease-3